MPNFSTRLFLLANAFIVKAVLAQSELTIIHEDSYNNAIKFSQENAGHIKRMSEEMVSCNNIFSGNYHKWIYFLAQEKTFKAIENSGQAVLDNTPSIALYSIDNEGKVLISFYFPPVESTLGNPDIIPDLMTDLVVHGLTKQDNINILFDLERFRNSDVFTVCEYSGSLTHREALVIGNTLFMKKGSWVNADANVITTFFNNLHTHLKSQVRDNQMFFARVQSQMNSYAALLTTKNGNLVGELVRLTKIYDFQQFHAESAKGRTIQIFTNGKDNKLMRLSNDLTTIEPLLPAKSSNHNYTLKIDFRNGTAPKKYENIPIEDVNKHLSDANIDCGVMKVCVASEPNASLEFECALDGHTVSIEISTAATLEFVLTSSDGLSSSIAIDDKGKVKIKNSAERKD